MIRAYEKRETTRASHPDVVFLCDGGFEHVYLIDCFDGKSLPELYVTIGEIGNSWLDLWDYERGERIGILKKLQTRTLQKQHCNLRWVALLESWHKIHHGIAEEQKMNQPAQKAEKKDHCNTVAVVVLLLLLPLCGVLLGFYLATVTR